jgi:hypothetical protein
MPCLVGCVKLPGLSPGQSLLNDTKYMRPFSWRVSAPLQGTLGSDPHPIHYLQTIIMIMSVVMSIEPMMMMLAQRCMKIENNIFS